MAQPEYADQGYLPGAKVVLTVRFEEFGDVGKKVATAGKAAFSTKPPIKMRGTKDSTNPLQIQDDPAAPPGVTRKILLPPAGPAVAPQDANASSDGYTFVLGGIIPSDATVNLNGPRQADTAKVTMRFLDCPVDPRTIRSCGIEIYIGTLSQEEFEQGISGSTRAGTGGPEPLNVVPSTYLDGNGNQRTNLRFLGWVDDWATDWGEDGEPQIVLECRDQTTTFIDQESPPKLVIDAKLPLDQAVLGYLANFPQFAGTSVEYRPAGATPPKLADAMGSTAFKPTLGPTASKGGGSGKLSVWDYITDVCGAVGHMASVEGLTIVIYRPRTLVGSEFTARADDPFKGRSLPSGQANFRQLIYGRNLASMKVTRKFAHAAPTNVEVRSYDPAHKKVIVARWPDSTAKVGTGSKAAGPVQGAQPGEGKEQKWLVHYVNGVKDPLTLKVIAQGLYEQVGRNELQIDLKTYNLASFGGDNLDPDILDMKAGDTFELLVNRDDDELSSMTQIESLLAVQASNTAYLVSIGFDPAFAAGYAKAYGDANFQTKFKLKEMVMKWGVDDGVTLDLKGMNYTEVRLDQVLPPGEAQA